MGDGPPARIKRYMARTPRHMARTPQSQDDRGFRRRFALSSLASLVLHALLVLFFVTEIAIVGSVSGDAPANVETVTVTAQTAPAPVTPSSPAPVVTPRP
jgi:hypothetical protein